MQLLATVKNNGLFRATYWVACLPLEVLRLVMIPPTAFCNILTQRRTLFGWLGVWACIIAAMPTANRDNALYVAIWGFIAISFANRFPRLFRSAFRVPTPKWRLAPRAGTFSPASAREILASIAVASHSDKGQTRDRMTARLSPELQKLVSQAA